MTKILTGLIGHPVGHSRSPLIHNYWIGKYGFNGSYEACDVAPGTLESSVMSLRDRGFRGFNVTIPYKQDVMNLCDYIDDTAQAIGAVNLVAIGGDGALSGFNTDAFGFIENIKEEALDFSFSGSSALVLGAGGAAYAVCYGLRQAGVRNIYITNRTREKAERLADKFCGLVFDWDDREIVAENAGLIVNTTSLGMTGMQALDFGFSHVAPETVVCDIVYAPHKTDFLLKAEKRGCSVVGGIGMLLHQARPSFEAWFGIMPEVTEELRCRVTEGL